MTDRHRYKMLPAPSWLVRKPPSGHGWRSAQQCLDNGYKQIIPRFFKPGWYYDRVTKKSWVEAWDQARLCPRNSDWLYNFGLADNPPLDARYKHAIQELIKLGRCPKNLREQLIWDENHRQLRDIHRGGKQMILQMRKESP